jgi:mono/diheme cytochrome c family protein
MNSFFFVTAMSFAQEGSPENASTENNRMAVVYQNRCSICHGTNGDGKGATSIALKPKPTDFTDEAYWAEHSDNYVIQKIKQGSPENFMPSFPKIPEDQILLLLQYLKKFPSVRQEEQENLPQEDEP